MGHEMSHGSGAMSSLVTWDLMLGSSMLRPGLYLQTWTGRTQPCGLQAVFQGACACRGCCGRSNGLYLTVKAGDSSLGAAVGLAQVLLLGLHKGEVVHHVSICAAEEHLSPMCR